MAPLDPIRRAGGITIACILLGGVLVGYGAYDLVSPHERTYYVRPMKYRNVLPRGPVHETRRVVSTGGLLSIGMGVVVAIGGISVRRRGPRPGRAGRRAEARGDE